MHEETYTELQSSKVKFREVALSHGLTSLVCLASLASKWQVQVLGEV